ncbi:MAG TPA: hypothetical protein VFS41_13215, partial [Edaphobacter sp.]|nr:hypothetical protein [Edaphobacter sp.]
TAPEPADTGIPITVPGLQPLGVSETPADDRAEVAASPETEMLVAETSAPAEEAVRSASMIGSEPGEAAPESSTNTLDLSTTALESPIPEAVRAVEVPVAAIPQPAPPKSSELPAGRLEEPAKFASAPAEPRRTLPQRPESAAIITPKPPEQPLQSPLSAKVSAPVASGTRSLTKTPVPPKTQEPAKEMFGLSAFDEPDTSSRWLKWSAWIAALIVLVIAPLVWLYMPSHPESEAAPTAQPATAAAPAEPVATPKQPGEDPDPAMVLKDWAAAMNSRDAAAQAAFYANPVERYFLRHNLSRDEVKADKQAAIDRRKGDWAVKMESIKVSRPDDKTAKARLIKHYTVKEEGKTASEWFVPSALQMTRTNGRWQITSERDLGWGTSLEELGY